MVEEIDIFVSDLSDDAFQQLYAREFVRAVRLAHLLTGSNHVAEDLAQEAFMRIRGKLETIDHPPAYLTATIVNVCRNWQRSTSRRERREIDSARSRTTTEAEHDEILDVVDRLPFRQRTVLVARYWLDLSEADITTLIGCRVGTVKSLASRALATLRKELQ